MITTADFPQADRLSQVGLVAVAIAKGYQADGEIEKFIGLDSEGRQGRYYRLAAEILGLIRNHHNYAVLTPLGEEFSKLNIHASQIDFLGRCLTETPVFQAALQYIQINKPSDSQLKIWFRNFYPGAVSTADRRFSTFMSYIRDAELVKKSQARNQVQKFIGSVIRKSAKDEMNLDGRIIKTEIPNWKNSNQGEVLTIDIDLQKRERANQLHWKLVDSKSSQLTKLGLQPFENDHIDLYATVKEEIAIYEMKSVNIEGTNLITQVRKAVSQLYEYRYIFGQPEAKLSIVTNQGVSKNDEWLLSYLANDRKIAYEWTTDFINFESLDSSKALLGVFA